jgi:hypothetical protein
LPWMIHLQSNSASRLTASQIGIRIMLVAQIMLKHKGKGSHRVYKGTVWGEGNISCCELGRTIIYTSSFIFGSFAWRISTGTACLSINEQLFSCSTVWLLVDNITIEKAAFTLHAVSVKLSTRHNVEEDSTG